MPWELRKQASDAPAGPAPTMRTSYFVIDFGNNVSADDVSSEGERVVPFGIEFPFVIVSEVWMEEGV